MNDVNLIEILKHGLLALMGGLVREIVGGGERSIVRFLAGGFVGIFCGVIVFFACKHLGMGEYITACFVGLGGYTGTPLLDVASRWMRKKFKRIIEDE